MEIEEQNVRSLEIFQRSSTLHSEEIKRYQQNLFVQKQLAESYSKRITELERSNLSLKSKSDDMESKMDRMTVELSTAQKEVRVCVCVCVGGWLCTVHTVCCISFAPDFVEVFVHFSLWIPTHRSQRLDRS